MPRLTPAPSNGSQSYTFITGVCPHVSRSSTSEPFPLQTTCNCLVSEDGRPKRKLVVCIDGTSNKFSATTSNVVEIFSHLVKDKEQMAYYNTGIGTVAMTSPSSLSYYWELLQGYIDMAFARNVSRTIMNSYQWLAENYEDGDVVYMFGFSRGAYQVRALAGMIERVGLVYKGNVSQIPFAYEMYLDQRSWKNKPILASGWESQQRMVFMVVIILTISVAGMAVLFGSQYIVQFLGEDAQKLASLYYTWWRQGLTTLMSLLLGKALYNRIFLSKSAKEEHAAHVDQLAGRFKHLCARDIKIHFVGCWDTVSSAGVLRPTTLPLANSTKHICFFRHALALHERRVKFLPEYVGFSENETTKDPLAYVPNTKFKDFVTTDIILRDVQTVKEVWFAGTHSDIGGIIPYELRDNPHLPASLRWMFHEASVFGLQFKTPNDHSTRGVVKFHRNMKGTGKPKIKCHLCPGAMITVVQSMAPVWKMLEYLPIAQTHYTGPTLWGLHMPHRGAGRVIQPGQKLHYSVLIYFNKCKDFPRARFAESSLDWETFAKEESRKTGKPGSRVEFDVLDLPVYDLRQERHPDWKVFKASYMAALPKGFFPRLAFLLRFILPSGSKVVAYKYVLE